MKNVMFAIVLWVVIALVIGACKKNNSSNPNPGGGDSISASKTSSIKLNEPVRFALSNAHTGDSIAWSVSPSSAAQMRASKDSATVLFSAKGTYTVMARFGSQYAVKVVSVIDSIYRDSVAHGGGKGDSAAYGGRKGDSAAYGGGRRDSGAHATGSLKDGSIADRTYAFRIALRDSLYSVSYARPDDRLAFIQRYWRRTTILRQVASI